MVLVWCLCPRSGLVGLGLGLWLGGSCLQEFLLSDSVGRPIVDTAIAMYTSLASMSEYIIETGVSRCHVKFGTVFWQLISLV